MNATVNVVLFRSKTLANGEHPLMIRICKDNKKKYQSLGLSVNPQFWDFDKNKPRRNCPNKEQIQNLITERIRALSDQVLEFKVENRNFTATKLIEKVKSSTNRLTVEEFINSEISRLQKEGRLKYAATYHELKASLISFNKHLDIYFSDIDFNWLMKYETWQRSNGLAINSMGVRFRTLRALYNAAIQANHVKEEYYPFKEYKVSKLKEETVKRSIQKSQVEQILNYQTERWYTQFSIDLFYFSYLSAGINFTDIAQLKRENIVDNRLIYNRSKTKKLIKLPIQEKAMMLIEKYMQSNNPYLFPILSTFHKTPIKKENRIRKVLGIVNRSLKEVGEELELPIDLTTYVARHSTQSFLVN